MFILAFTNLVPLPSDLNSNENPTQRLAQIRGLIADAEDEIRTLESLLTDFILNPDNPVDDISTRDGNQILTGNGSTFIDYLPDANSIRQQLYAARAYEGELRTAESAWNSYVEENKKAENKTAEQIKPGG